jgi:hypothetical protein
MSTQKALRIMLRDMLAKGHITRRCYWSCRLDLIMLDLGTRLRHLL